MNSFSTNLYNFTAHIQCCLASKSAILFNTLTKTEVCMKDKLKYSLANIYLNILKCYDETNKEINDDYLCDMVEYLTDYCYDYCNTLT